MHRRSRPSVPDGEAIGSDPDLDTVDPTEKYAKRRRHKTKADKYEYKGDVGVKRSAKGSRGSKRKRLRGSNTLNEDFQATNVDVARVSLKPENNLGIFSRSKKSVPLPGRDLPDLTFTKMDFLSKPAEAAKRDLAKIRMQQSDKKHKRDMTDEHFRAQSGLENSSAHSGHALHIQPTAEYSRVNDGRVSDDAVRIKDVPRRDTALESLL